MALELAPDDQLEVPPRSAGALATGLLDEPRQHGPGVAVEVGDHPGRVVAARRERRHGRAVDRVHVGCREHGAPAARRGDGERDPAARVGGDRVVGPGEPGLADGGEAAGHDLAVQRRGVLQVGHLGVRLAAAVLVGLDDRARRQAGGAARYRADLPGQVDQAPDPVGRRPVGPRERPVVVGAVDDHVARGGVARQRERRDAGLRVAGVGHPLAVGPHERGPVERADQHAGLEARRHRQRRPTGSRKHDCADRVM